VARFTRDGAALENLVERRQDEERKECRADEAADNNRCERLLDFATRACSEKHGDQTERGDTGGNEHRAQPQHSALYHCEFDVDSFTAQVVEVTDHDDAVEHRDAKRCIR
jgi:hypothetical protein